MKTYLLCVFVIIISLAANAQPVINGDMGDAEYTTLATFTSGRIGAGGNNMGTIKYSANGNNIYLGITGILVDQDYHLLLFFDFSGYKGRRENALGAGVTNIFQQIGGAKMDFDADYALAFSSGDNEGTPILNVSACRYNSAGVVADVALGFVPDQLGSNEGMPLNAVFGGNGTMMAAYNNGYGADINKGIELEIPISSFSEITNEQAVRVFAVLYHDGVGFTNETIPGDPGAANLGIAADFSTIANQKFFTSYAPLVFGISFEGRVDFYYPGPWMGDLSDNTPFRHDYECLIQTCWGGLWNCGSYAYSYIVWNTAPLGDGCSDGSGYVSYCNAVVENTDFLDNPNGITIHLDGFSLASAQHRDWGNVNDPPNGKMNDHRVYAGGNGQVYKDGVRVLNTDNNRISLDVFYLPPYGSGDYSAGGGSGIFYPGRGEGDAEWEAKFNDGNDQVRYEFYSFSPVVQSSYGAFDFTLILKSAPSVEHVGFQAINAGNSYTLTGTKISIDVESASLDYGNKMFLACECIKDAGGVLPAGIDSKTDYEYWELGTSCESIKSDVTFDISSIPNITNTNNLRILKRESANQPWDIYGDITLPGTDGLTNTQIKANNLLTFSEFAIGSTGGNLLPVEMGVFRANIRERDVQLNWSTLTERNNNGFEIERRAGSKEQSWEKIGFVKGHGLSNSPKYYTYTDNKIVNSGKYYYRLKQVDNDGEFKYSEEIMVQINVPASYRLFQNFPNPFNPSTLIKYQIPIAGKVTLKIYDLLGKEVATLVDENKTEGVYEVWFNASNYPSGVYTYQIRSNEYIASKKMMLVK